MSFARLLPALSHTPAGPFSCLSCRYVYDHIGGEHSEVIPELGATVATFAITTLWLGPCDIVYLWSFLNCFGLNFELWVQKLAEWGPLAQIEVSGEGLGQGLAGSLEGVHCCSLESSSHTWPPVRNFLTTTSWLSGQWLPLWVSSTPSVECGHLGQAVLVRPLPSLWSLVFPSLTTKEGCPGDSQRPKHNVPRTWGSPVGRTSDQLCALSPCSLAPLPMLSWPGQASLSEQMSRRVRALFGAMNFWAIIMYNLVSLNSLEFTELVARRLLLTGEGWGEVWIQKMPGINLEDCDLLKRPHPNPTPRGPSGAGQSRGEGHEKKRVPEAGVLLPGIDDLFPTQGSPRPLWPSYLSPTVVSSW